MSQTSAAAEAIDDDPIQEQIGTVLTAKERKILDDTLGYVKGGLLYYHNSGFILSLVQNMDFRWDRTIPTAATNGVFMVWNPDFFLSLDPATRVSVLAHEAWHVAFQHTTRGIGLEPNFYNAAADFIINNMLEEHDYDMTGFPFLLDQKYRGMSTEQVYHLLFKEAAGEIEQLMDNALGGDIQAPGDTGSGQNSSPSKGLTIDSKGTPLTAEELHRKMMGNLMKASTLAQRSQSFGNLPGEVKQMLEEFLNPKLPWRTILMNFFDALNNEAYSYRRPNRRYMEPDDPIMRGRIGSEGLEHICYYLDVSASVTDEDVIRFNSEVKHIKDTYNPEKLTLVMFDTQIQNIIVFEKDDSFEGIEVIGRGGTNLDDVYKHIHENKPNAAVIFTDLYVNIPEEQPNSPLIWVCCGNPDAEVPYGTLIHIDNEVIE